MVEEFLKSAITGTLPTGLRMKAPKFDPQKLIENWHKPYDVSLPRIGETVKEVANWVAPLTPNERIFEIFGSYAFRSGMTLLQGSLNLVKGKIFKGDSPMNIEKYGIFQNHLKAVAADTLYSSQVIAGKWRDVSDNSTLFQTFGV